MSEYRVRWEIDVSADDPETAAGLALIARIGPGTTATVFDVTDKRGRVTRVDLLKASRDFPYWCVLLCTPDQDAFDPCDRILWNVRAGSAKSAAAQARKDLAKAHGCNPGDIGVTAVALGEDSIRLPW